MSLSRDLAKPRVHDRLLIDTANLDVTTNKTKKVLYFQQRDTELCSICKRRTVTRIRHEAILNVLTE